MLKTGYSRAGCWTIVFVSMVVLGTAVAAGSDQASLPGTPAASADVGSDADMIGKTAPAFDLVTRDGKHITNRDLAGKVIVLNLWASWCPPCLEELPSLERLRRQVAGADVVILGVSVDSAWADVDKVVKETGTGVTMALDSEQKVARSFGTSKFPETYIIDRSGKVVRKLIGEQIWDRGDFVTYLRGLAR